MAVQPNRTVACHITDSYTAVGNVGVPMLLELTVGVARTSADLMRRPDEEVV
jgi:hypothetical protein